MGRYSKYQNTDNWFGTIPATWETHRIKRLFALRDKRNFLPLEQVNLISLYSNVGVRQHCDIEHTTGNRARNADGYKVVHKDDIIVNILLCWMGAIGRSNYDGVTSPAYDVYMPRTNINSQYYHYLFRTKAFSGECYKVGKGIMAMRWRTYSPQFMNINVPVPPRAEQDQIVRFLDWKVSEINKLIGIRRKEIKELEKLCWIVIVNAISKVKQKNISEWKRVRVKQICRMQSGTNLISQVIGQSGNYPVYGGNGLRGYYKNYTNDGQYVIIGRQGALAGNVHLVEGRFWATDHAIVVYCSKFLIPRYAYYLFTGMNLNQYAFNAAAQPGLSVTKILNLQCDVPSVARQLEIADRLDEICIQLEKIVNNTKKKIKLLQELKSVIISDVVTGKIDVRNIPVPDYEHVGDSANDGEGNEEETGIPGEED